jgi:hypothetical protein
VGLDDQVSIVDECEVVAALTIKRKVNTKHKLPVLNWTVLKPNQVKGTIFSELDDEKILSVRILASLLPSIFLWVNQ